MPRKNSTALACAIWTGWDNFLPRICLTMSLSQLADLLLQLKSNRIRQFLENLRVLMASGTAVKNSSKENKYCNEFQVSPLGQLQIRVLVIYIRVWNLGAYDDWYIINTLIHHDGQLSVDMTLGCICKCLTWLFTIRERFRLKLIKGITSRHQILDLKWSFTFVQSQECLPHRMEPTRLEELSIFQSALWEMQISIHQAHSAPFLVLLWHTWSCCEDLCHL